MTAADAREALEAAIWRTDPPSLGAVRAILAAADAYADAITSERIARHADDAALGPARLALAVADYLPHDRRTG